MRIGGEGVAQANCAFIVQRVSIKTDGFFQSLAARTAIARNVIEPVQNMRAIALENSAREVHLGGEMVMDAGLPYVRLFGNIGEAEAPIAALLDRDFAQGDQCIVGVQGAVSTAEIPTLSTSR